MPYDRRANGTLPMAPIVPVVKFAYDVINNYKQVAQINVFLQSVFAHDWHT